MLPQKSPTPPDEENPGTDSESDDDHEHTGPDCEGSDPDFDDEPVTDKVPTHIPEVVFDKYNPPMSL
jgi:hypothetical protein